MEFQMIPCGNRAAILYSTRNTWKFLTFCEHRFSVTLAVPSDRLLNWKMKGICTLELPRSDIQSASTHTHKHKHICSPTAQPEAWSKLQICLSMQAEHNEWYWCQGHIIIGLKRTLTVDSLMIAWSWISTAYNITVDDVQRSVLKPRASNILVKITHWEFISGYPSRRIPEELNKKEKLHLYMLY